MTPASPSSCLELGSPRDHAINQRILGENISDTEALEAAGKQLRENIDHEFIKLEKSGALKSMGNGRNDITDIVLKYIQVGSRLRTH